MHRHVFRKYQEKRTSTETEVQIATHQYSVLIITKYSANKWVGMLMYSLHCTTYLLTLNYVTAFGHPVQAVPKMGTYGNHVPSLVS